MKHGTLSGYKHFKCRCDDCKNAARDYEIKRLSKPRFVYPKPFPHGKASGYSYHKCRCDICCAYWRGYCSGFSKRSSPPVRTIAEVKDSDSTQIKNPCGSAEAYSFGCKCVLCMTVGREEYLKKVVAA